MESVENALLQEIKEEIGKLAKIEYFLGYLEYSFVPVYNSICHNHECNFVLKVKSEFLKKDTIIVHFESHIILIWQPLTNLSTIDFRPDCLKIIIPKWLHSTHKITYES